MYRRAGYSVVVIVLSLSSGYAQNGLYREVIETYFTSSSRLMEYDTIAVDWKMKGTIQADLNEGINNLFEEKPSLAEENFTQVITADSTIWQAYYYRSIALKQLKKLKEARKDLSHVMRGNKALYEYYIETGKVNQLEGDLRGATKSFEQAIRMSPERALAYYLKANLQWLEKIQQRNAEKNFNECLQRDSLFFDARIKLALIEAGDSKEGNLALPGLNSVLKHDSLNRHALFFRAMINFDNDRVLTLKDLNNLILVDRNNIVAYYMRGLLYTKQENYSRAFPDFNKIIEANYQSDNNFIGMQTTLDKQIDIQNAGAYTVSRVYGLQQEDGTKLKKAYCLLLNGEYNKSIAAINDSKIAGTEPLCLFLKGIAHEHLGQHVEAFKNYDMALHLDNDILDAHKKRGIYEQELKQWDKSIHDFTEVLRINPEVFIVYKMRGVSYFYENKMDKSISDFSKYLERDSTDLTIMGSRGMAYLKDGQYLKACMDFANKRNAHMLDFKKLANAVDSVISKGDTLYALDYINKFTKKIPYFTEGYVIKFKLTASKSESNTNFAEDLDLALKYIRVDTPPKDYSYLLTMKGVHSVKNKKYEEALQSLDLAVKQDKKNALAFLERGKVFMAIGKNNKAKSDLKTALSLGHEQAGEILKTIAD